MLTPAAHLLRRLAGRLDDETLAALWLDLGARELLSMRFTLLASLRRLGVALTPSERAALREVVAGEVELGTLPEDAPLAYAFEDRDRPPPEHETGFVHWVSAMPEGRRVLRAWRVPGPGAAQPAAWVHLVEVEPGTDVARAQYGLGRRGVHVVVAG
ncbi:hypothetical protein ACWEPH_02185 [Nocardia beijingensis]|uniref:hypothetical protein n=2 Tax=Nocardia beijingensis TaxID=95162 RepID=UPI001892E876|nr:hypothetical protein [Nocardia beijingensis]MBF6076775.1 hypothetical protein [Nocardia beijingensis]